MARALITGGAGFIGSHLAKALVEGGDEVRILDNLSSGSRGNLAEIKRDVEFIEGDIRNADDLEMALEGAQSVFHLAAMVSVPQSIENPKACYAANVDAVIQLMEIANRHQVNSIVMASSTAIYGDSQEMPLNETHAPITLSPYAASKLFNETLARVYAENSNMHAVALRFFNVYGPRQRPDSDYAAVIPRFIEKLENDQAAEIYGDGKQTRDFIYVEDVVHACLTARENREANGQAFNVCSGVESSLLDLLAIMKMHYRLAPEAQFHAPRLGDVSRSVGDPSLASEKLGFSAKVDLASGIKRTIEATI